MTEEKIQMFIMSKQKMFDGAKIPLITEKLKDIGDDKLMLTLVCAVIFYRRGDNLGQSTKRPIFLCSC